MFIGDTGIARVTKRTLEVMNELRTEDPEAIRKAGAIDLPTIQKYMNFWFSSALDLFGSESSSNAALYFASGLKGRPDEASYEEHSALNQTYHLESPDGAGVKAEDIPLRNAMNDVTRQAYIRDCEIGMTRWNRTIERAGFDFRYTLPSPRFNRSIGVWVGFSTDPQGKPISAERFAAQKNEWLPSEGDRAFVHSLMQAVTEPGKMAAWIAPPDRGINSNPVDYEYVRLA
jgi:benzoyl-CoA 2,3-dioxygenase component B